MPDPPATVPQGAASPPATPIPPARSTERRDPVTPGVMAFVVGLFVLAGHLWSINTGLYLDDHAHYEHLIDGGWSFASAVDAARLGIVGEVLDLWGRQEAGLRFFRPIAFWIMRAEYTICQWRPLPMHLISLGWHFACSMLVGAVVMRCFHRRFWALVAAALMAIHPVHVGSVHWIACQTDLLATLFLLVGSLAYSRHAAWGWRPAGVDRQGRPIGWLDAWFGNPDAGADTVSIALPLSEGAGGRSDCTESQTPPWSPLGGGMADGEATGMGVAPIRWVTLPGIAAVICYGLALGCKENAVLFPLVCWAGDRLCGSPRRWARWEHLAMGAVLAGYLALRHRALGGFPLPPPPYMMPFSADWSFIEYILYKVVMYTLGLFCFVPVVPIGSRFFFAGRPILFYSTFAAVVAILAIIWAVYRFRRALLWPLVWMGCFLVPVLPVFASPHHLYLPGVGMPLLAAAGLAALFGRRYEPGGRAGRLRMYACTVVLTVLALVLAGLTWSTGFAYVRGTLAEDLVVRDVVQRGRPLAEGEHLFFINLPVLAYYVVPSIEQELGFRELRGHVLTFAPDLIRMLSPSEVQIVDAHRLRIRCPDKNPYLSGITGSMLLGVMRMEDKIAEGRAIDAGLFTVTPTEVDAAGIHALEFAFRERLDSPNYHFYLGSPHFMAYPLDMKRLIPKEEVTSDE